RYDPIDSRGYSSAAINNAVAARSSFSSGSATIAANRARTGGDDGNGMQPSHSDRRRSLTPPVTPLSTLDRYHPTYDQTTPSANLPTPTTPRPPNQAASSSPSPSSRLRSSAAARPQ